MAFQSSLGIDITATQVALAYLRTSMRGIRLKAHQVYPLSEDRKGEDRLSAAGECIADFLGRHRISPEGFFFGLPGELAFSRRLKFPLAVKENLRETLRYEMEKYIPIPVEDIFYDYQVISEDKESKQLELLLVVVKKNDIEAYCQLAQKLRIGLGGIETRTAALANYFAASNRIPGDEDAVLAFVENSSLSIGMVSGQRLIYSASHPIGNSDGDVPGAVLSALKPLMRLRARVNGPLKVCLFGPGSRDEGAAALESNTEFEVCSLSLDESGLPAWELAPAYGLALKGLQKTPVQIDLVPEGLRKKPSRAGYFLMLTLTVLVLLASLAWGAGQILHQRQLNRLLDAEIEVLAAEIKTVDKIQADAKGIEDQIAYLNTLRLGGVPALQVLKEITEQCPDTAWVRDLNLNESDLRLDGFADSASELLPLLDESPFLKDVAFLSAITKGKDGKERFRIGGKLRLAGSLE